MAQQVLDVGSNANDGTGDNLRAAMVTAVSYTHLPLPTNREV